MRHHDLPDALVRKELILIVRITQLHRLDRCRIVWAVVEGDDGLAAVRTPSPLREDVALDLELLLDGWHSVVEVDHHGRGEAVLDVVEVVVRNLSLKLCVLKPALIIDRAEVNRPGAVRLHAQDGHVVACCLMPEGGERLRRELGALCFAPVVREVEGVHLSVLVHLRRAQIVAGDVERSHHLTLVEGELKGCVAEELEVVANTTNILRLEYLNEIDVSLEAAPLCCLHALAIDEVADALNRCVVRWRRVEQVDQVLVEVVVLSVLDPRILRLLAHLRGGVACQL